MGWQNKGELIVFGIIASNVKFLGAPALGPLVEVLP